MELRELVSLAKDGDKKSLEEIILRFQNLVRKWSWSVYVEGYEVEDLVSVGNQWIIVAVQKYDIESKVNFEAYLQKTIQNNYYDLIKKRARYNYTVSLNSKGGDGDEDIQSLIEDDINIENMVINKMMLKKLIREINKLSEDDKELIKFAFEDKLGGVKAYANKKEISYKRCYNRRNEIINILKEKIL